MRAVGLVTVAWAAAWLALPAAGAQPPAPGPAAQADAVDAAAMWPHTLSRNGASVTVYQPQAISWPGRQTLTARAAVAITPPGQKAPILGTIELSLATSTDADAGVVNLSDPKLLATHFPSLGTEQAAALEAKIRTALPQMQLRAVPLESVLLSLKQPTAEAVAVNNDPPRIFYSSRPASLVVFDGDPVLAPVGSTALRFAVNTNWDVFVDGGTWYLLNNGTWLSAPAAAGPYALVTRLPAAFSSIPDDANFAAVRKQIPARPPAAKASVPTIHVSTKPAEIIVTSGAPQLAEVAGTGLQRVSNSPNALFFDPAGKLFYVLFSGRWFSAASLDGPWSFATDTLPAGFALLPEGGAGDALLAAVPGTVAAQEAVLKSQLPTTATLQRNAAQIAVTYSGTPHFVPIPGTQVEYAVNTHAEVLKIGSKYYACENGAWFVSGTPGGPWILADSVPSAVKTIPPASPVYNVTYVQVYGATPAAVTYGYTAGYVLGYVTAGVLVYGTGYYYPPYVVPGPVPVYHPWPYTYAGSVYYNPANGAWARGGTIYGPYGGAATGGHYYNPTTGAWARGGAIYGPYGGAGAFSYYNPTTGSYAHGSAAWGGGTGWANASYYNARTGVSGSTSQNFNAYSRWGSSTFSGPNKTVNTQSAGNARGAVGGFSSSTGAQGAGYHNRVTGSSGGAVKTQNGDVYAGRDGNVYKHTDTGWSKWNNGGWNPVQRGNNGGRVYGSGNYQQLQQDRLGRQAGQGRYGGGNAEYRHTRR